MPSMSNRRTFIKQITALSSLSTLAGIGVSARAFASDTIDVSWLMPDELAWHAGTYIAFGASKSIWEDWVPDVQDALGLLSKTKIGRAHV